MAVRTAYVPVAGAVLTATNLAKLPGGWIGYNEVTASQSAVTTETGLTSLSLTVTVGTGRRIRVTGSVYATSNTANDTVGVRIKEGATQLQERGVSCSTANVAQSIHIDVVLTPTSGSHTYNLAGVRLTGAGQLTYNASSTFPSYILVEDLGATP